MATFCAGRFFIDRQDRVPYTRSRKSEVPIKQGKTLLKHEACILLKGASSNIKIVTGGINFE